MYCSHLVHIIINCYNLSLGLHLSMFDLSCYTDTFNLSNFNLPKFYFSRTLISGRNSLTTYIIAMNIFVISNVQCSEINSSNSKAVIVRLKKYVELHYKYCSMVPLRDTRQNCVESSCVFFEETIQNVSSMSTYHWTIN